RGSAGRRSGRAKPASRLRGRRWNRIGQHNDMEIRTTRGALYKRRFCSVHGENWRGADLPIAVSHGVVSKRDPRLAAVARGSRFRIKVVNSHKVGLSLADG